jgi:exoribonuclease-2
MIMANWMSARFLADHGVPAIFRSQPEPKARLYPGESDSLFLNYMQRKQVSRVIIGAEPEHHSGLGVNAYVTCTSPIRRYFDLVTQRQIKSILNMNAPYTKEEILSVYQTLDQTIASVYKAQYLRQRYFLLKHLEQRKGEKTDAIVLEKRKDGYFALLKEYIIECKLPGKGLKLNPQETIQVVIQHADPRKDLLSVFPG